ncbi:LysM peptidoglycan-binding domain-containing protein [Thalassiella azotivora]
MSAATLDVRLTGGCPPRDVDALVLSFPSRRTSSRTEPAPGHASRARLARPARAERPLRLTRRGRLVVTLTSLLVVTGLGVLGAQTATGGTTAAEPTGLASVTVLPGDTLWSIALEQDAEGDVRDRVAEIRSLNALSTSNLQAGQVLLVPTS